MTSHGKGIGNTVSRLFLYFVLFTSSTMFSQSTIWSENFTYSNDVVTGTGTGISSSNWSSGNGVRIRSNRIETRSSSSSGYWRTAPINIIGLSDLNVSFDMATNNIEGGGSFFI